MTLNRIEKPSPLSKCRATFFLLGPGGQNVNRVATKVDIRFHLDSCTWLSEEIKARLKAKFGFKVTKNGYYVIKSEKTRSQTQNKVSFNSLDHRKTNH